MGFTCYVGFLGAVLSLVGVLEDPASTSFPFGMSLVMIGIFDSSCQSRIVISTSYALMQNKICNHYFIGSLCTLIHMLYHVSLKLAIP
jgi:hypothetical protein